MKIVAIRDRRERGYALLVVLFAMLLVATAGLLFAVALAVDQRAEREEGARRDIALLVDSALAETLAGLSRDPNYPGVPPTALGAGTFHTSVRNLTPTYYEVLIQVQFVGRDIAYTASVVADGTGLHVRGLASIATRL